MKFNKADYRNMAIMAIGIGVIFSMPGMGIAVGWYIYLYMSASE